MVPNPWARKNEESYDFDITKVDKLFDFLLEKGQIKLLANHVMLPPEQLKNKKFYKYHNATSHTTNDCRIFRQHIQQAIQQGKLKFDTSRKMKVDDNPFLKDQNMLMLNCSEGRLKC
jgi:antitoxin component HigA of HigAB toxin-antitoxin module